MMEKPIEFRASALAVALFAAHSMVARAHASELFTIEFQIFLLLTAAQVFLLLRASRTLLLSAPLYLGYAFWQSWIPRQFTGEWQLAEAALTSLGILCAHVGLFRPLPARILRHPGLRWWRVPDRVQRRFDVVIRPTAGGELFSRTFEISQVGAFLPLEEIQWKDRGAHSVDLQALPVGTRCSVRITIDQLHTIRGWAEVVRASPASGRYPEGFGIRFLTILREDRKALDLAVRSAA